MSPPFATRKPPGAQRVVTLTELFDGAPPPVAQVKEALIEGFATRLGLKPEWGEVSETEEATARAIYAEEIGTDEFVYSIDDPTGAEVLTGSHTDPGGTRPICALKAPSKTASARS